MTRPHGTWLTAVALVSALTLFSQSAQAQTIRAEEIDQARRDKQARLWPESESPLVRQANGLVERGFREGVEDGYGANGPQVVLGGMRSGHGMTGAANVPDDRLPKNYRPGAFRIFSTEGKDSQ